MISPCLTLSYLRYISKVNWNNPGRGEAPSPTPRCNSYWKGSLPVALDYGRQLYFIPSSELPLSELCVSFFSCRWLTFCRLSSLYHETCYYHMVSVVVKKGLCVYMSVLFQVFSLCVLYSWYACNLGWMVLSSLSGLREPFPQW